MSSRREAAGLELTCSVNRQWERLEAALRRWEDMTWDGQLIGWMGGWVWARWVGGWRTHAQEDVVAADVAPWRGAAPGMTSLGNGEGQGQAIANPGSL